MSCRRYDYWVPLFADLLAILTEKLRQASSGLSGAQVPTPEVVEGIAEQVALPKEAKRKRSRKDAVPTEPEKKRRSDAAEAPVEGSQALDPEVHLVADDAGGEETDSDNQPLRRSTRFRRCESLLKGPSLPCEDESGVPTGEVGEPDVVCTEGTSDLGKSCLLCACIVEMSCVLSVCIRQG